MNTLTDLRRTLDQHADDVVGAAAAPRIAAVHQRVAFVRRRRRALGTGAVALALVVGFAAVAWPKGSSDALPAAPVLLGQQAPTTERALGYTYRTDGKGSSFSGSGAIDVAQSDQPRLFSWTTSARTRVTVALPGREVWHSRVSGFHDYVVIEPGVSGKVRFAAARGDIAVASYRLTDAAPAGAYRKDGVTFRSDLSGAPLLRALVGDPGQTELTSSVVTVSGQVATSVVCSGLPSGDQVHVSVGGRPWVTATSDSCRSAHEFDPASEAASYGTLPGEPGHRLPIRVRVTSGEGTPLAAGAVPGLQVGVALYGPLPQVRVGGQSVPRVVEHGQHTWAFSGSATVAKGAASTFPSAPVDRVVQIAFDSRGPSRVVFRSGDSSGEGRSAQGGAGGMGGLWAPAGSDVRVRVSGSQVRYVVAFYERID